MGTLKKRMLLWLPAFLLYATPMLAAYVRRDGGFWGPEQGSLLSLLGFAAPFVFALLAYWGLLRMRKGRMVFADTTGRSTPTATVKGVVRGQIVRAPGTLAESILTILPGSKGSKEKVFGQTIADMRAEYIDAMVANNRRRQVIVFLQGHLSLFFALTAYVASSAAKRVIEIWKLVV